MLILYIQAPVSAILVTGRYHPGRNVLKVHGPSFATLDFSWFLLPSHTPFLLYTVGSQNGSVRGMPLALLFGKRVLLKTLCLYGRLIAI